MAYCSYCGSEIPLFRTVRTCTEICYETGLTVEHRNICVPCNKAIMQRNSWYKDFVNFFSKYPGKLEALELIHEKDLMS